MLLTLDFGTNPLAVTYGKCHIHLILSTKLNAHNIYAQDQVVTYNDSINEYRMSVKI
jgi:hypothetical protein